MSPGFEPRLRVSIGFAVLIVWFAAVNGPGLLAMVLSAAALHELGHWLALRLCGAEVRGLQIGLLGAVLETDCARLSYGRELAAVLAGPGTNLLCAWVLSRLGPPGLEAAVGAHLVLGGFNLLPLRPLDGGRALYLLTAWVWGPWAGDRAARWCGTVSALMLSGGLLWLMGQTGGSLWLLPAAVGLLGAAGREWFGKDGVL